MVVEAPILKICPRCKITMLRSKSHPSIPLDDTWKCLQCDFTITVEPRAPRDQKSGQ
jgi:transposase-like protein